MNKRTIKLLLAAVGLVILAVGYYVIQKDVKETDEDTGEEVSYLLGTDITQEVLDEFSFQSEGRTLTFAYKEGDWYYTEDETFVVDVEKLSGMLSALLTTEVKRTIDEPEQPGEYGLNTPSNVITYKTQEGSAGTVTLGTVNATTKDLYVYLNNDKSVVYCVSATLASEFGVSLGDMQSGEP